MTFHGEVGPHYPYAKSIRTALGSQPPFPFGTRPPGREDRIPRNTRERTDPCDGCAKIAPPVGESHQRPPAQGNSVGCPKSSRPHTCEPKYRCLLLIILDVGRATCAEPITWRAQILLRGRFASVGGPGARNLGNARRDRRRPGPPRRCAIPLLRDNIAPGSRAPFKPHTRRLILTGRDQR